MSLNQHDKFMFLLIKIIRRFTTIYGSCNAVVIKIKTILIKFKKCISAETNI